MKNYGLAGTLCTLLSFGAAYGAHAAPETPPHERAASARSLPGDTIPAFGMLDEDGSLVVAPALPASARHGTEPESDAPGPSLAQAIDAARAAVDACAVAGYRVGAAVIDSVGEARALLSADGSNGRHAFIAMRKALTALRFEMPSSQASEVIPRDPELLARVTPNMFVAGGAIPIIRNSATIGAIGVSGAGGRSTGGPGAIGRQDEACAVAGLHRIEKQLR